MSRKSYRGVIVCEDQQHEIFIRRYLAKRGFDTKRKFRFRVSPKGSGEQFVRKTLVEEIKDYRRLREQKIVIGMIDADKYTITERVSSINKALEEVEQKPVQPNEPIAIFVPDRNIESWLQYANQLPVEHKPNQKKKLSLPNAVDVFFNKICQEELPNDAPEPIFKSIRHACDELAKIL